MSEQRFDPIAMEVFGNRLLSITESMAINMMRASFSPQIKERRDFSVGIFDGRGRLVAQGIHIPVHLGSLLGSVEAVIERYGLAGVREGEAYVCNDCYVAGGTHLPDISIVTPVFLEGRLVAFCANIGHHSDVGGAIPGSSSAKARTAFEEGLRIPVIRVMRERQVDEDVIGLIALNSRLPEERALDLKVQISTNEQGVAAVRALIARMGGVARFDHAVGDMLAYTERRTRQRIAALPRGRHAFTTWLDDDGAGGDQVPLTASVQACGDTLVVDFAGSGAQARGGLNVAWSALRATVYYCVKALLDHDLMANSGIASAIEIRAPEGSILNPRPPAACGARTITCQRLAGAIFGAFRALLPPEEVIASGNDTLTSFSFSGPRAGGGLYVAGEAMGGGGGARGDADGMDGIHVHITNTMNLPTEAMENEFPLRVERYGLVEGSGGAGMRRGGMGILREVRALHDGTIFSARSDSHKQGAAGAAGGGEGGRGRILRNPGTPREESLGARVVHVVLSAGETVRIETPGGGGYGDPAQRPLAELAADLRDGILDPARAADDYGAARLAQARPAARQDTPSGTDQPGGPS